MISVQVFGNVGSEPEMATTTGGTNVLKFSVASNEGRGQDKSTTWSRISVFGKQAETLRPLVAKGNRVLVIGTARLREWTGRDGGKRTDLEVDARDVQVIDYPERDQAQQAAPQAQQHAQAPAQAPRQVSPDGLYEYDGRAWVPRAQAAPPAPPPPPNGAPPPPPAAQARVPF
jgi:single-strand DNA-binding protein